MAKNKLKRYTGSEVTQPKSIAEQLLEGTKLGNLLYGKQQTYKDGNNQERKETLFKESANGQLVQRMKETATSAGRTVADNMLDIPMDIYSTVESGVKGDWAGAGIAAASVVLPQAAEGVLKQGVKIVRKYNFDKQVIDSFREYLRKIGANDSEFTDDQLMDLLSDRKEQFLSTGGEKLLSTPDKVELYKNDILAGHLSLGDKGIEGQMISGIERQAPHEIMPENVSTPLYTAGIKQSQDNGFAGLESGHDLKRADKTLKYINLHNGNFEGRVVGEKLGKASTTDKEQAITAEWFKRYQEALSKGFDIDDAERYAYEFSERLADGLPSYHFDESGNPIVEGWEIPIDVIMLTKGNHNVNHVSLFPNMQSINHRRKNGAWNFSEFHQDGGTLKMQYGGPLPSTQGIQNVGNTVVEFIDNGGLKGWIERRKTDKFNEEIKQRLNRGIKHIIRKEEPLKSEDWAIASAIIPALGGVKIKDMRNLLKKPRVSKAIDYDATYTRDIPDEIFYNQNNTFLEHRFRDTDPNIDRALDDLEKYFLSDDYKQQLRKHFPNASEQQLEAYTWKQIDNIYKPTIYTSDTPNVLEPHVRGYYKEAPDGSTHIELYGYDKRTPNKTYNNAMHEAIHASRGTYNSEISRDLRNKGIANAYGMSKTYPSTIVVNGIKKTVDKSHTGLVLQRRYKDYSPEDRAFIDYLLDGDEARDRAINARRHMIQCNKTYDEFVSGPKSFDVEQLYQFFTPESVKEFIDKVFTIGIPISLTPNILSNGKDRK